jgi:hypothetical protein
VTVELFRYDGFPSGWYGGDRGDAEVRLGPWVVGATRRDGGLVEAGLKLHFGGVYHASFGTWDVRAGGGYGAFPDERAPHLSATLAYGVRGVLARHIDRRQCEDAPIMAESIAEATVARAFVTLRHGYDDHRAREVVFGVELSPTFLLPPYSWFRFGGGPPR